MDMEMILIYVCMATFLAYLFLKPLFTRTTNKKNLPPSPWRLPVIGNLHQMSLYPHRCLHSLSLRYGPLMLLHFGSVPILVVSSADAARDVMKTHDIKFSNRPKTKTVDKLLKWGTEIGFSPYGEYWRKVKSICVMKLLSNKTVSSFENIREEEINVMMEKLEKASFLSSPVNLSEFLTTLTNDVLTRIVLGRKYSHEGGGYISQNVVRRFMELLGAFPIGDFIPVLAWIDRIRGLDSKVDHVLKEVDCFLERTVQEHEDHADEDKSDFLYLMLSLQSDKTTTLDINRSGLKLIILDMLFAGTVTTFTLIEWTMTELMRHPECMKKLQDEIRSVSTHNSYVSEKEVEKMNYLNLVIKEVLRVHPPAPMIPRQVSEDVELHGYDIAAGTQVLINVWAIQRETATWGPDAEEFRPERHLDLLVDFQGQNYNYIPFGSGRRGCPGIGFALALVGVTLANLVKRFEWRVHVETMGDDKPDLAEAVGADVCRKFPLVVCPSSV